MRITTALYPGQNVTVGDVLVGFDAGGICTGIVSYSDGRPHENTGLLAPEQIEVLRSVPDVFTVIDDEAAPKSRRNRGPVLPGEAEPEAPEAGGSPAEE